MQQFTEGFIGNPSTELVEFGIVMGLMAVCVVCWCAWYMRQD